MGLVENLIGARQPEPTGTEFMNFQLGFEENSEIRDLTISDDTIGYHMQLGIEIGTLESFFSFQKQSLGSAKQTEIRFDIDKTSWEFLADIAFEAAEVRVSEQGKADESGGWRALSVRAIQRSNLMDSVLRFVAPKKLVTNARIGNRTIVHERRNRYHQYPADTVDLLLRSGSVLRFTPEESHLPRGFISVVYLRDEPEDWILHFRALAATPSEFTLKGCVPWYNRPLPPLLQSFVFSAFPALRSKLLFVRERVSQRIPIQVNGAATIEANETLSLSVRWTIENA